MRFKDIFLFAFFPKRFSFFFLVLVLFLPNIGFCQIPSLTGATTPSTPPSESRRTQMSAITQRAMAEAMGKLLSNPNLAGTASPLSAAPPSQNPPSGTENTNQPENSQVPANPLKVASGTGTPVYDSSIDNHLDVPTEPAGIFGLHVKEAEKIIKNNSN
ncbi:hypothetical protein HYY75_11530 [bacterium]|nr:hypothetical protein [bacterium]